MKKSPIYLVVSGLITMLHLVLFNLNNHKISQPGHTVLDIVLTTASLLSILAVGYIFYHIFTELEKESTEDII